MTGGNSATRGEADHGWTLATVAAALAGVLLALGLWGAFGGGRPMSAAPSGAQGAPSNDAQERQGLERPGDRSPTVTPAPPDAASAAPVPVAPAASPRRPDQEVQPAIGACLAQTATATGSSVAVVACTEPHRYEVVGLVETPAGFRTAPTDVEWRALLGARCPDRLRAYLGDRYDPAGILVLRVAGPSAAEWSAGDRTGECLVSGGTTAAGTAAEIDEPLSAIDQSPAPVVGTCLRWDPLLEAAAVAVPCGQAHQLEVVGALDLAERFEHYPSAEQWGELDRACIAPVAQRYGDQLRAPSGNPLEAVAVRVPVTSWLAGRRASSCAVAELDPRTGRRVTATTNLTR